ncbi:MAG TPA: glutaredoxin family protein [Gammaproteobacteria bacterium]|nr:glutaredoxin family protein [Gammaproteobacteria bacterium]
MPERLQIYVRHGCHLCDDMLVALETVKTRWSFELEVIDIGGNEAFEASYGTRVPLLKSEHAEICYYFLDEEALQAYFSRS